MKRSVGVVLTTLIAGSAVAGSPPQWAHNQAVAAQQNSTQANDSRDTSRDSRGDWKRSSPTNQPSRNPPLISNADRGDRQGLNDARDSGRNASAGDWKRQAPRMTDQPRREAPPMVRSNPPPTARNNPPPVASTDRAHWANDGRGDRRGFSDPRPHTNWQSDHDRPREDDRHWNRDHNDHWNLDHNWYDRHGRDWRRDRWWYDQYRYNHYRFYNDRFYARQRFSFGFYYAPFGYSSRVWFRGDFLPFAYFDDRYFVDRFDRFDLYDPPYGCRWIRVGSDALLVDVESGYILDVIYNLFW